VLKEWQFNVLFFVGVGGAVLLLLGPEFGLNISQNPTAITGVGAILTYVLTQKHAFTKPNGKSGNNGGNGKTDPPITKEPKQEE
jgi:hypothetical protein